ncbi:bifunctional diguanylate cyclase/phosphodiesterase [Lacimicrobium sp. SS2-24]|uniref:putative bifunctional diguanylate cyclase/phosphodiesterase n=1 Tax=Lacimicrobium sp. SS2-24 TaxID=2005569 RepID=UPI000B4A8E5B|nr:bifunctional diguanylate cyclase/phosphodiesterase [Lacimicrobium sp. SS2-24]
MKRAIRPAVLIALAYVLIGAGWILFSDMALEHMVSDPQLAATLQTIKGWLYVGLTGLLLFFLLVKALTYIEQLNQRDSLTGLLRPYLFTRYLEDSLDACQKNQQHLMLVCLDIDGFKEANRLLGYAGGDTLLRQLAVALKHHYHADDLIARLGTDQFALAKVLTEPQDDIESHAVELNQLFSAVVREFDLTLSCSVGLAKFPRDARNGQELLFAAQSALKEAKRSGQGMIRQFNQALSETERERQALLKDLRHTIDNDKLSLVYQPQFSVDDGGLTGCEVLVRWNCPQRGFVGPDVFIPLAERNNLISGITAFVVRQANKELSGAGLLGTSIHRVSVNISAQEFNSEKLMAALMRMLNQSPQLYPYLQLEITETAALSDLAASVRLLTRLREQGLKFSIDDFGTGYSSLAMLKNLPIDEIKIDKDFIHDLLDQPRVRAIVEAVTTMAHSLDISVVAEGVETQAQLEQIRFCGCHEVQGYLTARPMNIDHLKEFVRSQWSTSAVNLSHHET